MTRRNLDVYIRTWKTNMLPPLVEPILYLLALGYGLGALVEDIDGIPYRAFIAPGLIAITIMQTAFFETTYSSYVRMVFQKTWDAIRTTPLSEREILVGELIWAAMRSTINASIITLVIFGFGLVSGWTVLWVPLVAFVGGFVFAGAGLVVCGLVPSIDQFSYAMYLFITPMFLFAGTFFPISQLPQPVLYLALAFPLTHVVNLVRYLVLGVETGYEVLGVAYLLLAMGVAAYLGVRTVERKIRV